MMEQLPQLETLPHLGAFVSLIIDLRKTSSSSFSPALPRAVAAFFFFMAVVISASLSSLFLLHDPVVTGPSSMPLPSG